MSTFGRIVRSVRAFREGLARDNHSLPTRPRIGIALGGGFARGVAHIGVLRVLEEEGVPIDFVAGTSAGALAGAVYCSGLTLEESEQIAAAMRFRDFARWTFSRLALASNARMAAYLERILPVRNFEDLKIPLAVAATDFVSGEGVVFRSGPVVDAVRASCAYPGMFLPVELNGRLLVDGLLSHPVPTQPLRQMGADRVIAVYLSAHWCQRGAPKHIFEVIGQCFSIAQANSAAEWKAAVDLVIEPDVSGCAYDGFDRAAELICAGETAMRAAMPQVRQWLEQPATKPKLTPTPAVLPAQG